MKYYCLIVSCIIIVSLLTHCTNNQKKYSDKTASNIVDVIFSDEQLTTFAVALRNTDLMEMLRREGPYTVFAPTDEAFAELPEATLNSLMVHMPALTKTLLFHITPSKIMVADIEKIKYSDTVLGEVLSITADSGKIMVGSAHLIAVDIEASNGVIHLIDTVLFPPSE